MASTLKNPKQPWLKFYPSDWRADQTLRICSLAARGLWMECLCVMHQAEPYGHLVVNGQPVTDAHLAMLAGTSSDEARTLISELEAAGVFSRNRDGVIYSRRLTRDLKMARTAQQNGRMGGNPSLSKQRAIRNLDNLEVNRSLNGVDKAQKPEARSQNIPPKPPSSKRVTSIDDIDRSALEEWASREAPHANVSRELTKAEVWTRSKQRQHKDALAFMQKWLIKASDEAGPPPDGSPVEAPEVPKGTASHRAIERALTRLDKPKAKEIYQAYQRDPAEAERLARAYLEAA